LRRLWIANKRNGAYISIQVRIYAYMFLIFFRKIFIEIQQNFDESESTKKESLIYDSMESKFKPRN